MKQQGCNGIDETCNRVDDDCSKDRSPPIITFKNMLTQNRLTQSLPPKEIICLHLLSVRFCFFD